MSLKYASVCLLLMGAADVATAQAGSKAAEAEIAAILAELSACVGSFEHPPGVVGTRIPDFETSMQGLTALAARIDLFEPSFGVPPDNVKGWADVQALAKAAAAPPRGDSERIYFVASASGVGGAILREISGDLDGAMKALDRIRAGGGCGNWVATVSLAVDTRRSAILQKKGQFAEALAAHERAVANVQFALHSKNVCALHLRHGLLLELNDRADDAHAQYQRVVDLFPKTAADAIARRRLSAANNLLAPTAERLKPYLAGDDTIDAIAAIGAHGFPESVALLTALLDESGRGLKGIVAIEAMRTLDASQVIPRLRARIAAIDAAQVPFALVTLAALGDTSQLIIGLERLKAAEYASLDELQATLIGLHPDGPKLAPEESRSRADVAAFATRWLDFLAARQPVSRPTSRATR